MMITLEHNTWEKDSMSIYIFIIKEKVLKSLLKGILVQNPYCAYFEDELVETKWESGSSFKVMEANRRSLRCTNSTSPYCNHGWANVDLTSSTGRKRNVVSSTRRLLTPEESIQIP